MAHTPGVGPVTASAGAVTSLGVVLNGTTAGRSLIALMVLQTFPTVVSSVTCTSESNLTLLTDTAGYGILIAYLSNITTGGNKTLTANFSATTTSCSICAIEFAGGNTAAWYDGVEIQAAGVSNAPTVNITTATAGALVIGLAGSTGGQLTQGSGYTFISLPDIALGEDGQYNLNAGVAGSKTFNFTTPSSGQWAITCASFRQAPIFPIPIKNRFHAAIRAATY